MTTVATTTTPFVCQGMLKTFTSNDLDTHLNVVSSNEDNGNPPALLFDSNTQFEDSSTGMYCYSTPGIISGGRGSRVPSSPLRLHNGVRLGLLFKLQ